MSGLTSNADLANAVLDLFFKIGVHEVIICPGGRNSPFVDALAKAKKSFKKKTELSVTFHFEERSASYFALGKAKVSDGPVAIITTSGTACGEMLSALMEARYSGQKLVAITCDRPKRFRGSGAPQTCDQVNLFGKYAHFIGDLESPSEIAECTALARASDEEWPIHLNVCFEDPIREYSHPPLTPRAANSLECFKRPLVLIGELSVQDSHEVKMWLRINEIPHLAEPLSQIRECPELAGGRIESRAKLSQFFKLKEPLFDSVIRIGGVPVNSFWRDLETDLQFIPVLSLTKDHFAGLARPSWLIRAESFKKGLDDLNLELSKPFLTKGFLVNLQIQDELATTHASCLEAKLFSELSQIVPKNAFVYLGNSLAIRQWDSFAVFDMNQRKYGGNRGLNGIDGQVSTFLGMCDAKTPNVAILGDLTFLYDLAGLWHRAKDPWSFDFVIFIINNGGGMIFKEMFESEDHLNCHETNFQALAEGFGLNFDSWKSIEGKSFPVCGHWIIELKANAHGGTK